jgi:regulator of protease activity HflC (stomatin/prohibitin superfamily)
MNIDSLLKAGTFLLWILVAALIVLVVVRASRRQQTRNLTMVVIVLAVVAALLSVVAAGLVFIQPNERGVVISALQDGVRQQALQPGLNWIVPFFENVKTYPISRQTYTMSIMSEEGARLGDDSILARTLDGQEIVVDASVIYAVDPNEVVQVHIDWQDRYSEDLVRPQSRGVIRDAVSQFRVEEVVSSKRQVMADEITKNLEVKLAENGLILVDFILRNITFSDDYAASVEKKQIAEQEALQAEYVVESRKQEAEQARQQAQGLADAIVIRAEGDAKARLISAEAERQALDLINQAIMDNPDLLTYLYINKIAPGIEVMLLPNNTPFFYQLPTLNQEGTSVLPTPVPTPIPTEPAP